MLRILKPLIDRAVEKRIDNERAYWKLELERIVYRLITTQSKEGKFLNTGRLEEAENALRRLGVTDCQIDQWKQQSINIARSELVEYKADSVQFAKSAI